MQEQRTTARARRTKVRGKPGIYHRLVSIEDGGKRKQVRRYELTYLDSDGKRRWQAVPGYDNLDDAERLLTQVKRKLHRGVRVAPSRKTFDELADEWLAQLRGSERTRERYDVNLRHYLRPRFGNRRAQEITVDDVARLIAEMEATGKAGWTIRNVLTTLSSLMSWAKRRGMVPNNPVADLEPRERPKAGRKLQRVFERDEITALLEAAADKYRPLLATALFAGLRLMELLGLRWQDVDFAGGYIRVRKQLGRDGQLKQLKSDAGRRDVVLMPELAQLLRRHKTASRYSQEDDFVFCSRNRTPLHWRNVETRGFDATVTRAKLQRSDGKPVLHDCRHTFASLLIAQGLDIVFISRQLGHANPATTLRIYAHLFDRANHETRMRETLSATFGQLLPKDDGHPLLVPVPTRHANRKTRRARERMR
jgi:integrase